MQVKFYLLSIILALALFNSASADKCTPKMLVGTHKPRFQRKLQQCAQLNFLTTRCQKILRRENCRKKTEEEREMNKGLFYLKIYKNLFFFMYYQVMYNFFVIFYFWCVVLKTIVVKYFKQCLLSKRILNSYLL